jgi:hypothetical protein
VTTGCPLYHVPEYGSFIARTACNSCLKTSSLAPHTNTQSTHLHQPTALNTRYCVYTINSTDSRCDSLTQPTSHPNPLTIKITTQIYDPSHFTNLDATHFTISQSSLLHQLMLLTQPQTQPPTQPLTQSTHTNTDTNKDTNPDTSTDTNTATNTH